MTMKKLAGIMVVVAALACFSSPQASAETMWGKLRRGAVNLVSGVVEIPGCIYDVSAKEGALVGATWGTVKGVGMGPVRTMVGIWDIISFPIPSNDYEPVLNPTTPYDYFSDQDKPKGKPSASYAPRAQGDVAMLTMGPGPLDYAPVLRR
jgi:putative exosortase-associated protein (TIGR04073 family)